MSSAGGPKDLPRRFEIELLGQLWEGKVNAAIELLKGALEWVRNPAAVKELLAYLEKRRAYSPDYQQRQWAGLWIASTRVEKYNDWAVSVHCKNLGNELVATRSTGLGRAGSRAAQTVNSTPGVGTVRSGSIGYRKRFARPLDRRTSAPTRVLGKKIQSDTILLNSHEPGLIGPGDRAR